MTYYTIKQAAAHSGLSAHTLRYYDREGLMPLLGRTASGIRRYTENDLNWLSLICCLKNSGMQLSQIKAFMELCLQGPDSCEDRKKILENHRQEILQQLDSLKHSLTIIDYKLEHYREIGIFHIDQPDAP